MSALWLKAKLYLVGFAAFLVLVLGIFFKGKSAGRASAVAKQREIDDEARKRMDAVEPATSDSTIDSLRNSKF